MNMSSTEMKRKRIAIKNKAIKRRNIKRAVSLVFYSGTLITTICMFFAILSQGMPSADRIKTICTILLGLGVFGSFSFGKIVLVATKRKN